MKNYRFFLLGFGMILLVWATWIGYTWHMMPVYVAILIVVLLLVMARSINRKKLLTCTISLFAAISIVLLYLFPFVELPKPTGSYAVGVTYRKVDTDRDEIFTRQPGDTRSLYLKIWYPAQAGTSPNPYLEEGDKAISYLMGLIGFPSFPFHQLTKTKTHGFTDAPVAAGQFPLLTFSHGYGSWFGQNTALMEELASRGYIVASIAHSHQTLFAAANEKELVLFPQMVAPGDTVRPVEVDTARQNLMNKIFVQRAAVERSVFENFFRHMIVGDTLINQQAVIWANDITSTIDFILADHDNSKSFFHKHVDAGKVGSMGMSLGGAASAEAALRDNRILAAVNMDGLQFGTWITDTIKTPVLFLEGQRSPQNFSMYSLFFKRSTAEVHGLLMAGAQHENFSDASLFSPVLKWMGVLGEVDGDEMIHHMNVIVPDYFTSIFSGKRFEVEKHLRSGVIEEPVY